MKRKCDDILMSHEIHEKEYSKNGKMASMYDQMCLVNMNGKCSGDSSLHRVSVSTDSRDNYIHRVCVTTDSREYCDKGALLIS